MRCPQCQSRNRASARFCAECGTALPRICSACGAANPSDAQTCAGCGGSLSVRRPTKARAHVPSTGPDRRQLTIMFCDLVGSTAMSERLDPEVMREVLHAYRATCAKVIKRYDGRIAQYIGDGILVYFGYPQAHEDDARRAVSAGLEILTELKPLSERLEREIGMPLSGRIGVHTGLVVAGDLGAGRTREALAIVGDAPNLAARLHSLARPGTLVISDATRQLVDGLFSFEDLGEHSLKGVTQPTSLYEVRGPTDAVSAFDARASRGLFPFLGRDRELSFLIERWARAQESGAQAVLLSGEAGVGKSRLIRSFMEHIGQDRHRAMLCFCSPYRTNSAFFPIIDQFERALRLRPDESVSDKLDKLDRFLSRLGADLQREAAVLAGFLSLGDDGRYSPVGLAPRQVKQRAVEALIKVVEAIARRSPTLIIVEDVHWVDPSTLEFLQLLPDRLASVPVLILMSHRPEFRPAWADHPAVTKIALAGLASESCGELIASITAGKPLPASIEAAILAKSDGIPLFVEELTKNVLESGVLAEAQERYELSAASRSVGIPSSLKDSLMARLDRLGTAKEVAQLAAIVGRRFSPALLSAISPLDEASLRSALSVLTAAGLIHRGGPKSDDPFVFKHALVQDAAYDSLLKSSRVRLHGEIARAIETTSPETAAAEPELLAHHYTQAGMIENAVEYWRRAAQTALARAAQVEALVHLDKALELLERMPETVERHQRELMLLVTRGLALTATRSYAAPEVGANYARAHELCRRIGNAPQIFPVLHGLYRFYLVRADLKAALETTKQLLAISAKAQDETLLMEAHQAHAFSLGFMGELEEAQPHYDACLRLFDPERAQGRLQAYSTDTAASVLCLAALVAWLRGFPDRAAELIERALTRARAIQHPYTSAWVLNFAAVIYQIRGQVDVARRLAEECVSHSQQHEFPFWLAGGRVMRGWCMIAAGEKQANALPELREALADWRRTGAVVFSPYFLCCIFDAHRSMGRGGELGPALDQGIAEVEQTGERWWEAELYRARGELYREDMQAPDHMAKAEACFSRALELTRKRGARSLELRAALSLAGLWRDRGKRTEARDLLAAVYAQFDEGFDTADLRAAEQLIAALS